ncbi:MAG: carbohydrate kinase family protein [Longimicrobiales bacterium]|nr:carbohydrate kinase family protein [Longimicrobiales bacterium]
MWDTIHRPAERTRPVQEWGGIAYALSALAAALPDGWEVVPLLKVGRDLSEEGMRYLRALPGVDAETGVRVVPAPNNRVDLRYLDGARRTERLSGGVPPWHWAELAPLARSCDALYVNFISGFEMDLDAARALRAGFPGPTYADLHSLFLGLDPGGVRVARELPAWGAWLRCFDAVQMNEAEFELLGRAWGDPWALAAHVVGPELKLIAVTLGERGSAYVAAPDFRPDPMAWPARRHSLGEAGTAASRRLTVAGEAVTGDPTGCGDVWGATFFARLLAGDTLEAAMASANAAAARNVLHRGAHGLHHHLRGRIPGPS